MSVNHPTADKNELHYRKIGAVGGRSGYQKGFVGGSGRGGGGPTAPPLSNSSTRSFKKTHNGQSRVNEGSGTAPEFNDVPTVENGSHAQPTLHVATSKTNDAPTQRSTKLIPKAPSSQSSALTPEAASTKGGGGKGKGFALQFGSISPGLVNGVPVPPRTTSAPPNLDEQLQEQACHDASGRVAAIPVPSAPKPEMTKKDTAPISQHTSREVNADSKLKRDTPATHASSVSQAQKPPVLPMGSISMLYPQPPVSLQFGGPNPQKMPQCLPAASHPMPMQQMPLQIGNPYPMQQQIHLPHHLMQVPGIMHQSQGMGFNPQMGLLPHHSGGLGMNIPSQFTTQQPAKFGIARKPVKITHPETHEELRLEKRGDVYPDGTASKPHNNVHPQSQNVPSYPPNHSINYYNNSYGGPAFIGPSSSLSFPPSPRLTPAPQVSRFNHPVTQVPHPMTFMNQLASNTSTADKGGNAVHGTAESAKSESAREVQHTDSSASVSVTVKAGIGFADKGVNLKGNNIAVGTLNASSCGMQQSTTHSHAVGGEIPLDNSSDMHLSTVSDDGNVVIVANTSKRHDGMSGDDAVTKSHLSGVGREDTISVSVTALAEGQGMETANSTSSSGSASISSIAASELNKTKSTLARGKKKIKEILQKADAQGTTSDLYMAYKGPEEMKESTTSAVHTESISSNDLNLASAEFDNEVASIKDKDGGCKAEPEDWEDAVDILTPKLESASKKQGKTVRRNVEEAGTDKKYTRDFLLTFLEQCINLPDGFEIISDIADILIRPGSSSIHVVDRQLPSPGRIVDRPSGGPRVDRCGGGMMDADRRHNQRGQFPSTRDAGLDPAYGSMSMGFHHPAQAGNYGFLKNPHAQPHVQYPILSAPMQSMQRNANDRWRNTNFMPPPQTPMQIMHKAEKKYEIGKTTDEEEAKQRTLKGILNKLTPQNFDKLFAQVKEVNIDNVVTLNGVISQIFDKALTEPTFCEMYSNFCYELSLVLPELSVDDEKITFKRLLLNKCQEEFERGEREEDEANKADTEEETKLSEGGREERRLKARRLMLGNIRLIGELYKRRMLTEKIMHECIRKLLTHYPDTSEEDIESLCKLMSTIGDMIDNPKGKVLMNGYFELIERLSNNMRLSSRVRFMLKDAIDLRKNKWQERRKVEGPKKIDEVHRDAAQERHAQASRLSRGPNMGSSMRRGQPMEYVPRGSSMLSSPGGQTANFRGSPSQGRGYGMQAVRMEEKQYFDNRTIAVPLPQRSLGDDSITLGPQGGLAKGMSMRGHPSSVSTTPLIDSTLNRDHKNVGCSIGNSVPTSPLVRVERTSSSQNMSSEKVWPEERLREMSAAAIKEFYSAKDENEVGLCVRDMNAPSFYPSVICIWVTDSFERKDLERDLLTKLIVNLSKPCDGRLFIPDQLIQGFESVLTNLEDTVNDAPKAPDFLGRLFARVILENIVSLKQISGLLYDGGEEPGRLREAGLAGDVLGSILENIKSEKGEAALKDICSNCNLQIEDFRPPAPLKSKKLELFTL